MSSIKCHLVNLLQKSSSSSSSSKIAQCNGTIRHVSTSSPKRHILATSKLQAQRPVNRSRVANASTAAVQTTTMTITSKQLQQLAISSSLETLKRLSHRLTQLDPLGLTKPELINVLMSEEALKLIADLRQNDNLVKTSGLIESSEEMLPISRIVERIFDYYIEQECGLEFAHLSNQDEISWLTSRWEQLNENFTLTSEQEIDLAKLLLKCEQFDHFLGAKFPTTKRYGCEGAESMLIVFDELLRLAQTGASVQSDLATTISDVIIAMPHRGRLNLLACLLGLNPAIIFNKCLGEPELNLDEAWMATGDVLSHLSLNNRFVYGVDRHHLGLYRESPDPINLSLLPNPSHLEMGAAMCMGAARGRAHNLRYGYSSSPKFNSKPETTTTTKTISDHNDNYDKMLSIDAGYSQHLRNILSIQVHGDASLAGQGIIQETLQMANLQQFNVAGSIHLVVNNQIGYTTSCEMGRSSRHCTDVFKLIEAPIVHVNGENIPSVLKATQLAFEYRQKFGKDIALNLICFRRHGHNEMDEPSFTQPLMYKNIRARKSIPEKYCQSIRLDHSTKSKIVSNYKTILQEIYQQQKETSKRHKPDNDDYRNFALPSEYHRDHLIQWQTGCDENLLRQVGLASVQYPTLKEDPSDNVQIQVHPTLERTLVADRKVKFAASNEKPQIDWATAEMLAIGSLLRQSHSVRIAGQDVARGTFSTRHAVFFDQLTERPYVPLNWIRASGGEQIAQSHHTQNGREFPEFANVTLDAKLEVANTILSEEAALAYEFGYSIETCELTIWEAQFGDFFNTAQSIVDTLISCSEAKWMRQSALTMLLPHGLDGAGPEHSSSRLERFLQLSKSQLNSIDTDASVNWSVCFPTLPSQYFHLLRRQVLRPFRKPLVVMSPKIIFRNPQCQSPLSQFGPDKTFQPVLDDPTLSSSSQRNSIDTLLLCSGKIYFQLDEIRSSLGAQMSNVALIRLEELCPFPVESLYRTLQKYPNGNNRIVWFQEEHKNQGAYQFVQARLANLLKINQLGYIGRDVSELTATGSSLLHKRELVQIIDQFKSLASPNKP